MKTNSASAYYNPFSRVLASELAKGCERPVKGRNYQN